MKNVARGILLPIMENQSLPAAPKRKALISYKGWVMILLVAFLVILRPVHGQNIDYLAGRFVGSVLVIAAIWALVAAIIRQMSRSKTTHN
jgi:hypothetical protein